MSRHCRTWVVISAAAAVVCLSVSALADEPVTAPSETVATWKGDELVPPLPLDPAARAAAIEEAGKRAAARATAQPVGRTVNYTSSSRAVAQAHSVPPHGTIMGPVPSDPSAASWLSALQTRLRGPDDAPGSANPNTITLDELGTATAPEGSTALLNVFEVFDGVDDTGLRPPAPDIAAGPNHLMVVTTDRFAVMDKCGQTLLSNTLRSFFSLPASRVYYTPRVIYDEWNDHWVMVFIGTETNYSTSSLYTAYSATGDPTGTWYFHEWKIPDGVAGLKDLPCVSATPDAVYFTWDRYNLATFAFESAVIGQVDRAGFYSGGGATMYMYTILANPNDASAAHSVRPAQMRTYSGEVWFINSKFSGDDFFTLWKITGPPSASVLTGYDVATGAYTVAPDVAQPDATLMDSGDCRITDAVYSSGHVYTTHTVSGSGRPSIRVSRVDVSSITHTSLILTPSPSYAHAYGALDIDENDQVSVVYSTWGIGRFPGVDCTVLRFAPPANLAFGVITNGTANFHSGVAPYRWGPYAGCARDPSDDRTMWLCSVYASDSPLDSWTTTVAAVSLFGESQLTWTPTSTTYSGGFEGGPFSSDTFTFNVQNTGQTTANWYLFSHPGWVTPSDVSGHLGPGDDEPITFHLNAVANTLTWDIETGFLTLENCTGSESNNPQIITLGVGLDGSCLGAKLNLSPPVGPPTAPGLSTQDVGVFVTAIEEVTVCSVGFTADLQALPQLAYARIYAANGTTRGALLTEGVLDLVVPGESTHYIPLEYTLQACQEYEIAFLFTGPVSFDGWTDASISLPYDVGGVVRVRKGSSAGLPNGVLKPIEVIATENECQTVTTLYPGGSLNVDYGSNYDIGAYVTPIHTVRLCTLGLKMLTPPGADVRAKIYTANAGTRVSLLAEGHMLSTTPILDFVDVPIDALLLGGSEYDFAVEIDGTVFAELNNSSVTPFIQDGLFEVQQGEVNGVGNPYLHTLRVGWTADQAGTSFNLGKLNGPYPPPVQLNGPMSVGAWVTSLIDQELYSLGVYADVPAGGLVSMVIYPASGTTVTGPALSYGHITSYAGGSHWHDVPLSASLEAGADYVFDIFAFTATGARAWLDTSGLPYDVYGILRIRDADSDGNPAFDKLVQMRMCACNATATPIMDGPTPTPMYLDPPAPNPASELVRFGYSIDEAGPVDITVYDVSGHRVASLLATSTAVSGRAEVGFDASGLASGIYFVKLTTRTKDMARKFVVTH
jgi:Secretion system C-terminal sorting domain